MNKTCELCGYENATKRTGEVDMCWKCDRANETSRRENNARLDKENH